jgi:hypothetical protein
MKIPAKSAENISLIVMPESQVQQGKWAISPLLAAWK